MNSIYQSIRQFCVELGKDPLLVQGAGGNVSWKDNNVLWIKGSGTWLAHADKEDIFVPVNLASLKGALSEGNFDFKPQMIGEHYLRPSIETVLHALMPQKFVIHLHTVNALSHLVMRDCEFLIRKLFQQSSINNVFVEYYKPGPELARATSAALIKNPSANVVFMKNHGIVVGGESIEEVRVTLDIIEARCDSGNAFGLVPLSKKGPEISKPQIPYVLFPSSAVQQLALNSNLYQRLKLDWVLFPDHAVFLGSKAFKFSSWEDSLQAIAEHSPELLIIENAGVFIRPDFNMAKSAQLCCYFNVISRIAPDAQLAPLDDDAVDALLNWDAEKLRQKMSK